MKDLYKMFIEELADEFSEWLLVGSSESVVYEDDDIRNYVCDTFIDEALSDEEFYKEFTEVASWADDPQDFATEDYYNLKSKLEDFFENTIVPKCEVEIDEFFKDDLDPFSIEWPAKKPMTEAADEKSAEALIDEFVAQNFSGI